MWKGYAMSQRKFTKDELIEDLRRCAEKVNGSLTSEDYQNLGNYSISTIRRYFGSWNDARKEAKIKVTHEQDKYDRIDVVNAVIRANEKVDGVLTKEQFKKEGSISYDIVIQRFDNWNSVKRFAGLDVNPSTSKKELQYTDKELFGFIDMFVEKNNRLPQTRDFYESREYPSATTYQNRFGTWKKALKEAGYE